MVDFKLPGRVYFNFESISKWKYNTSLSQQPKQISKILLYKKVQFKTFNLSKLLLISPLSISLVWGMKYFYKSLNEFKGRERIGVFSSLSGLKLGDRKYFDSLVQYTIHSIIRLKIWYFLEIWKFQTFITTSSFAWFLVLQTVPIIVW